MTDWWGEWERHNFSPLGPLWDAANPAPLKKMKLDWTPKGPFRGGQTVEVAFSAVDIASPSGPDLHADIYVGGVAAGKSGQSAISVTVKTAVVPGGALGRTFQTVSVAPQVQARCPGYVTVSVALPVE